MTTEVELTQDDLDINYVRTIRKELIETLIVDSNGNRALPTDAKDVNTLAGVLSDMDRTALTIKRLAQEKDAQKSTNDNALLIANMLSKITGLHMAGDDTGTRTDVPSMPDGTVPENVIDGMLDTQTSSETYADFAKKMATEGGE